MKRWDNIACDWSEENEEGRWVLFEDHRAELERLQEFTQGCVARGGELVSENKKLRDELTAANLDLASAKLLIGRIDEVAAFPTDGADIGRKCRLHNIRDKISIYRRDDRGQK